jgi:peptidoglycan/LPS O-acetylase OafA/YrhL
VVVYHAGTFTGLTWGPGAADEPLGPWVQHLNVGVSAFFVLSGFLLFRPFVLAHLADDAAPATRPYLVRRLVRIFPAYWVALFVSTLVLDLELGDWWGHVRFYGLLQIYWGDTVLGGLVQAWSLCTELSFYLFLPLWAAALRRVQGPVERRIRAHAVGLVLLYVLGLVVRARLRAGGHAVGYATLPANADLFAIGMGLALVRSAAAVRGGPAGGLARTVGDLPGVAWAAAGCCYLGATSLGYPFGLEAPTVTQELLRQVLFGLVAGLVVAPGVFGDQTQGMVRRVLRSRPLWGLGVISYGIYLWHLTVMERLVEVGRWVGDPSMVPLVATTTALTVAIAALSWFGLEKPLLGRVRRPERRRRSSRVVA